MENNIIEKTENGYYYRYEVGNDLNSNFISSTSIMKIDSELRTIPNFIQTKLPNKLTKSKKKQKKIKTKFN